MEAHNNVREGPRNDAKLSFTHQMKWVISWIEMIAKNEKMSKDLLESGNPNFRIAFFGFSTENAFMFAQLLIDHMHRKYKSHRLTPPKFHVFFNDINAGRDLSTILLSRPNVPGRPYTCSSIPGPFHTRLLPDHDSLHFGFSSYFLHRLSQVPAAVTERSSPAWNKGSIYLKGAPMATVKAYQEQFAEDLHTFLSARAEEMVAGGYFVLMLHSGLSDHSPADQRIDKMFDLVESTLMDMVKTGLVNKDEVEAFNIPFYHPTEKEIYKVVKENGSFDIECNRPILNEPIAEISVKEYHHQLKCMFDDIFKINFGPDAVKKLHRLTLAKLKKHDNSFFKGQPFNDMCVLLRRNST